MDVVVVDTPGLAPDDHAPMQSLKACLAVMPQAEIHLLLSATAQDTVMDRIVAFFKPLNIQRLLFTKLDWAMHAGAIINQAIRSKRPIGMLSDSSRIPEGLHDATAAELSNLLFPDEDRDGAHIREGAVPLPQQVIARKQSAYVANRNSDIFHHSTCKSVKRIHSDNMIIFKDSADAMAQRFKPCRTCCSDLVARKTIQRPAKRYAGSRC
jgi:hypothetical protein